MQWSLFNCDSFHSFYETWSETVSSFLGDTRYDSEKVDQDEVILRLIVVI
jgi:hypothetical protein